jgi:hypothetical protein
VDSEGEGMKRYQYLQCIVNDDVERKRTDIEKIIGPQKDPQFIRYCIDFTWRNSLVSLEKIEEERRRAWMESWNDLEAAKKLENEVNHEMISMDVNQVSGELKFLFQIIEEYRQLDQEFTFPQNRMYKIARIQQYKKILPALKDLGDDRFIEMVQDQSIIHYYLTQERLRPKGEKE